MIRAVVFLAILVGAVAAGAALGLFADDHSLSPAAYCNANLPGDNWSADIDRQLRDGMALPCTHPNGTVRNLTVNVSIELAEGGD